MMSLVVMLMLLLRPGWLIVSRRATIRAYATTLRKRSQLLLRNALRQLNRPLVLTLAFLLQLRILRTCTWPVPTARPHVVACMWMMTLFGNTRRRVQHSIHTNTGIRPHAAYKDL